VVWPTGVASPALLRVREGMSTAPR
jgi:hypothetical protein